MGWTSFHLDQPVKEWFKEGISEHYEVLDIAIVKRNTLYAALKNKETGQVFCAVYLVRWTRDWYNFSYKDMTEFYGPNKVDCPKRIMKLLTPLTDELDPNGYARNWRKDVHKYWEDRDKIKMGGIIKTRTPVQFTSGSEYQYFKKIGKQTFAGDFIDGVFRERNRVRINFDHWHYEII